MRLPSLHIVATQDEQLRTCLHNIAVTVYEMIATKRNASGFIGANSKKRPKFGNGP
jgi:hypothetical protein